MTVVLRLAGLARPYSGRMILAAIVSAAAVASNVGLLTIAGYLLAATARAQPIVLLTLPIYAVRLLAIVRAGARYLERVTAHDVTFRILAVLRLRVFDRLAAFGPLRPPELDGGTALQRFIGSVDALQDLYLRVLSPAAVALLVAALTAAILHHIDATLTWIVLGYLALAGLAVPFLATRLAHGLAGRAAALRTKLNGVLVDAIQGLAETLTSGRSPTPEPLIRAAELDAAGGAIERRLSAIEGLRLAGTDLMANLAVWSVALAVIPAIARGDVSRSALPVLAFFVLAVFEVSGQLGAAFGAVERVRTAGAEVFAIIDAAPPATVTVPVAPLPPPRDPTLTFAGVTFVYPGRVEPAVRDLSLTLAPGQRISIVGPSGAGKTSIVRLALGMIDPTMGTVSLGGHDLRTYRPEDVYGGISLVDHETHIFTDTIRGNLLVGRPDADDTTLWAALEEAQLRTMVESLPLGLDTPVGERGATLSGGQRQRLAIARALLKDAPILILDEPTANLDRLTEAAVLASIDRLMAGRTVLTITHRLTQMDRMDQILVLAAGRVVERGTHDDLVRSPGLYRRLYALQEDMLTSA